MRYWPVALSLLALSACKDDFDDYQVNPIHGSWQLSGTEGIPGCTVTDGLLQAFDIEGEPMITGDFFWSASCDDGTTIMEAGDITGVETDQWGADYGIDITLTSPMTRALDWDCTMNDPELTCIESSDAGTVVIFEFQRTT